jgi:hypothetical protein
LSPNRILVLAAGLALLAGCLDDGPPPGMVADTTYLDDPDQPGTVLRRGPATPDEVADPSPAPTVEGATGRISVYDGFFVTAPCAGPPRVDASLQQDTIHVDVISDPAVLPTDSICAGTDRAWGYAVLVGPFEAGSYAVRLRHQGDRARPPLDTVLAGITIEPRSR